MNAASAYQNRKITSANKDLKKKTIAFVKASEAHMSFGSLETAINNQSYQSEIIRIADHSKPQAIKNAIQSFQDKTALHHHLIVRARAWRKIVVQKSMSVERVWPEFSSDLFYEYAVKTLTDQGCSDKMNINTTNANLSLITELIVSTRLNDQQPVKEFYHSDERLS